MPALIAMRAAPEQFRRERSLLDRWARIYSRFNEVLSGILIVRSFTMEESEKNRFLRDVAEANNLVIRGVASDTGYGAASNFVVAAARLGRTRSWSGRVATMPLWYIGNIAASYPRMMQRTCALQWLARLLETFLELRELLGDRGMVLVGHRELR